jgi:5-hydroxyisourate hydrolase
MGISTHILDTELGRPATGVKVTLSFQQDGQWLELLATQTDQDGRCKSLLPEAQVLKTGIYRVHFATADYYVIREVKGLYPFVEITVTVTDATQHYHIPLLLTANGYTTYRGS